MKRYLSMLLALLMLICAASIGASASDTQKSMFIFNNLNCTCNDANHSYNSSYPYRRAFDFVGPTGGEDNAYAPFDCKVVYVASNSTDLGHTVAFESLYPVECPDGTTSYITFMLGHDNDISDQYNGREYSQGAVIYQAGNYGISSGNHIHLEVCKGRYSATGGNIWSYVRSQSRVCAPSDVFFLYENTTITNSGGYSWTYASGTAQPEPSATVSFSNATVGNLTETNAMLSATCSYSGTRPSSVGVCLGHLPTDTFDYMWQVGSDTISHNKNPFDMWYDLNKYGTTLSASTEYRYQFYAIVSGTTYWSDVYTFRTPGAPTVTPEISSAKNIYATYESVTLSWTASNVVDAYWLHIYKDGADYINQSVGNTLSYTGTFPAGNYTCYVSAYNSYGERVSAPFEFKCGAYVGGSVKGDVDGNGLVNLSDAVMLMKYIANWDIDCSDEVCDVNCDGSVNLTDVVLLLKFLAGWDVVLG